ncbi:hypothetical protein [Myroides odoratus]|uniref:Uncharacterized protein n=1 Tax=Myroides odoratus TaxID=256 RepID=A0A378RNN1_MYROD|nr:hypothetical protein [Myroides odoratus]QQU04038.1 hypothetical protein I6I89_01715 [Myroides odoratus]STZ28574.1 Uncharacterised protein [Myroides odoratus]
MELVRGSRTIKLGKKGDTISSSLIADKPLVAKYQNGVVVGSWVNEAEQRTVYAQVLTSLTNTPLSTAQLTATAWKFNGQVIADTDARFEKTTYSIGSIQVPALKIKADIMNSIDTTSAIEFNANAYTGGYTTAIAALINVVKENISANTYNAYIIDANGRGATITTTYPSVTLKAILEKGGIAVTDGITYQWYKSTLDEAEDLANDPIADNRMLLPGKTQQTITLTAADIQTYDTYIVEIKENGQLVKSAMMSVRDETDSLELMYNVEGIEDDLQPGGSIKYTPKVVYRGTTTPASGTWIYKYQKVKVDGTSVGAQTSGTSVTVTYGEIEAAGVSEISVLFEATEN